MAALGHTRLFFRVRSFARWLSRTDASSLAEFAISLPLLVVLVVGIFDFGGAFNQKQELNNAMREGARFGASQPTNDLCSGCTPAPPSVDAIRVLVDSYLLAAHLNDCGLSTATATAVNLTWTYTPSSAGSGCAGPLTLIVTRGYPDCGLPNPPQPPPTVNIPCTNLKIVYPYVWHFNSVIQLLVPGSNFALTPISTSATVANTD